jgi:hypothetical protein
MLCNHVTRQAVLISVTRLCSQYMAVKLTRVSSKNNQYRSSVNPQSKFKPIQTVHTICLCTGTAFQPLL